VREYEERDFFSHTLLLPIFKISLVEISQNVITLFATTCDNWLFVIIFGSICNYTIEIQNFGHSYDFHATMLQLFMLSLHNKLGHVKIIALKCLSTIYFTTNKINKFCVQCNCFHCSLNTFVHS
jgi:hypothetical protein